MPQNHHPTRRRVLQLSAGTVAVGLAGCLGAPGAAVDQVGETGADDHHDEATGHHDETTGHHDEATGHDDGHEHAPTEHDSGHGHSHEEPVTPAADAATVRMTSTDAGHHFEPHVTWVNPGGTVTWVNESGTHTATAYHPDYGKPLLVPEAAEPFDSGLLTEPGAEFAVTFDVEGVYHVYCAPHEALGMLGTVIVGEPDPHDQPALGEIPTGLPGRAAEKLEHLDETVNEALGHTH